jgi:hypothetical protein
MIATDERQKNYTMAGAGISLDIYFNELICLEKLKIRD